MYQHPETPRFGVRPLLLISALAGLAVASLAAAGPLDRSKVPAEANIVVHLDLERALATPMGRVLIAKRGRLDADDLDNLKAIGVDPFTDFKSVTAVVPEPDAEHGVVILHTTPAIDALVTQIKSGPSMQTLEVGGQSIISWDDKGKKQYAQIRTIDSGAGRLAFISDDWSVLSKVLQTADGKAPALPSDPGTSPRPSEGSFFFVHARTLPEAMKGGDDPNASAILGDIRGAWLDAGQRGETCFAAATVEFANSESPKHVTQMAQGFIAFARMMTRDQPDLVELRTALDSITLTSSEQRMTATFERDAARVARALEQMIDLQHDDDDEDDEEDEDEHGTGGKTRTVPGAPKPAR